MNNFDDKNQYSQPKALGVSKITIQRFAEEIAEKYQYDPLNHEEDIYFLVGHLGGEIDHIDDWGVIDDAQLSKAPSGSLIVDGVNKFKINLPFSTSLTRDKFTIAHELGHYFLHYLIPNSKGEKIKKLLAYRYGNAHYEFEANNFAAALLMPTNLMNKLFLDYNGNFYKIAILLGLSDVAVKYRLRDLGHVAE